MLKEQNTINSSPELISILTCFCCGKVYCENRKAYMLSCGHNICSSCLNQNKIRFRCVICSKLNTKELISSASVNFVLNELIHKVSLPSTDTEGNSTSEYKSYCEQCDILLASTKIHNAYNSGHLLKTFEEYMVNKTVYFRQIIQNTDLKLSQLNDRKNELALLVESFVNKHFNEYFSDVNSKPLESKLKELGIINDYTEKELKAILGESVKEENLPSVNSLKFIVNMDHLISHENYLSKEIQTAEQNTHILTGKEFIEDLTYDIADRIIQQSQTSSQDDIYTVQTEGGIHMLFPKSMTRKFLSKDYLELKTDHTDYELSNNGLNEIYMNSKTSHDFYCISTISFKDVGKGDFQLKTTRLQPQPFNQCFFSLFINFKIYCFGRENYFSPNEKQDELPSQSKAALYNCITKEWFILPPPPSKVNWVNPQGFSANGKIYILDGLYSLLVLDISGDDVNEKSWKQVDLYYNWSFDLEAINRSFHVGLSFLQSPSEDLGEEEEEEKAGLVLYSRATEEARVYHICVNTGRVCLSTKYESKLSLSGQELGKYELQPGLKKNKMISIPKNQEGESPMVRYENMFLERVLCNEKEEFAIVRLGDIL